MGIFSSFNAQWLLYRCRAVALPQACGKATAAVRQSYHRPVVALPNGSGRRKDGHLWKGKWASVNGKTCICGREDKTLFSSYNPNYLLFPIWQFCQIDYSPWEILSTPLLLYIYTRTHTRERKANRIVWVFYKSACLFQKKSAILTIITLILYNHTT